TARATTDLTSLNLDFAHGKVRSVEVDGLPAGFKRAGEDLVVTPEHPVLSGERMRVTVRHTSDPARGRRGGWVRTRDGLAMANQPDAAHWVFPCNDHPADKALFAFHVLAPRGYTVVASGLPLRRLRTGSRTAWTYRTEHPMATELAQVSIGRSAVLRQRGPHGLPLRHVVPRKLRARLAPVVRKTAGQIGWMEKQVGPFPFETYGVLMADAKTGFELETQTLSLFETRVFTGKVGRSHAAEAIMVHELAHQWFGDSVSPETWSDLWLNEGHATWYQDLWLARTRTQKLVDRMRQAYRYSDGWRKAGGPPAAPRGPKPGGKLSIFRPVVYEGSALVLYALRQEIGKDAFQRLERAWVSRYADGTADTADFTALASETAGKDLSGFLHGWLYGKKTPPMPRHPHWKSA
ncbi:MAG: M1 family metallopeptidase, partial [Kitasatospora sp.]|nr:M1 family metallopeptidase [Kitasatospora sp.]